MRTCYAGFRAIVAEENSMKSNTEDEVKGKPKEELGKVMNDPTLEGKDENKVGRVQRKTAGKRFRKMTLPAVRTRDQCVAV
jgi:uncharacterized protein YjbJ (UPF0337 family)